MGERVAEVGACFGGVGLDADGSGEVREGFGEAAGLGEEGDAEVVLGEIVFARDVDGVAEEGFAVVPVGELGPGGRGKGRAGDDGEGSDDVAWDR